MTIYRLGRHHHDTVYLQLGDEPSNHDDRVAVFMRAEEREADAERYVRTMNGAMRHVTAQAARDRCRVAALAAHERAGLAPSGAYANSTYDAIADLIREDERSRAEAACTETQGGSKK